MREYLVQYGRAGFVGRFITKDESTFHRRQRVVIHSPRGLECGLVLGPVNDRFARSLDPIQGDLLRPAADPDDQQEHLASDLAEELLGFCESRSQSVTWLDCEVNLDRTGAVIHLVAHEACQLDGLFRDASEHFGLSIRVLDVTQIAASQDPPEPKTTCDKPGCGSGSGGCSSCSSGCGTSSCSKGSVKSAGELTAYFQDLRHKMDEQFGRKPLH